MTSENKNSEHTCTQVHIKEAPKTVVIPEKHFAVVKGVSLPALEEDELLIEAEFLSVDPYMRSRLSTWAKYSPPVGSGFQVAKILESRSTKYKPGQFVYGQFLWATRSVIKASKVSLAIPSAAASSSSQAQEENKNSENQPKKNAKLVSKGNPLSKLPHSNFLGVCGMPSMSAYYGMIERGGLKKGENVLISGAAGAVGSVCGQIAKNVYGCHVAGSAGSDVKVAWLKQLGFDSAFNYKPLCRQPTSVVQQELKKHFPNGIDLYFDNVGGFLTEAVWDLLNPKARVVVCGQIAHYNEDPASPSKVKHFLAKLIYKEIDVRGMIVANFKHHSKFYADMATWVMQGKVQTRETTLHGIESVPQAFAGLFTGQNIGKMVVKL